MRILITGVAGFIGSFLARNLAQDESNLVLGIDNLASYYAPSLKERRLIEVLSPKIEFQRVDISQRIQVEKCLGYFRPHKIFHLAAQPGIRLDVERHHQYTDANLNGFCNLLNGALKYSVGSFIYASSSSVYGNASEQKLSEHLTNLSPTSFYGATKLANEVLAKAYSYRYGIRTRGLRFFTVYGPWGRPDMSYFRIIASLLLRKEFMLYGDGSIKRDFTFIDDVVALTQKLGEELDSQSAGFSDVVNIGGGNPISIGMVIDTLSRLAKHDLIVARAGTDPSDVLVTNADSTYRETLIGQHTFHTQQEGLKKSLDWATQMSSADLDKWLA